MKRKSNEKAWQALTKTYDEYKIKAGWFENSRYKDNTPIGGIAAVQNYGAVIHQTVTPKQRAFLHYLGIHLKAGTTNLTIVIPPTHFMENCENKNTEKWKNTIAKAWAAVFAGNIEADKAMEQIGMMVEGDIAKSIKDVEGPPLSPMTIKARLKTYKNQKVPEETGINKRLAGTGVMFNSVSHKVEKK